MSDKEQITTLIDSYTNLQRIANAEDKEKEINNQMKITKAKLESFGVVVEDLLLEK